MNGERDLETLLRSMSPKLSEGEFVFVSFRGSHYGEHAELAPIAAVDEREGLTLVVPRSNADDGNLSYAVTFRRITLNVHSSLEAVGLTAAFSTALSEHAISANVVAGRFHDHIFVPCAQADDALRVLQSLTS